MEDNNTDRRMLKSRVCLCPVQHEEAATRWTGYVSVERHSLSTMTPGPTWQCVGEDVGMSHTGRALRPVSFIDIDHPPMSYKSLGVGQN
jgi:hypothetical protein